jgi:hypothetical protein
MASSLTQADVLPDESQYASKVQNEKIFEIARKGQPQDLILEVEDGTYPLDVARSRKTNRDRIDALKSRATTQADKDALEADQVRSDASTMQALAVHIRAIKDQALSGLAGRVTLIRDFSVSTTAVIRVSDKASLLQLLANPLVKMVYVDEPVHESAI